MSTETNLKSVIAELHGVFAQHLPNEDVAAVLRKAVEKALDEVLGHTPKRRGRPPKSAGATAAPAKSGKKRKGRSPASRRKQAAKMRAYWAARKASEAKSAPKKKRGRPAKAKTARAAAETMPSAAS